jgi:hypothetical protein
MAVFKCNGTGWFGTNHGSTNGGGGCHHNKAAVSVVNLGD